MSYLGNAPARSFISFERQVFSIVNSQTAYALSHSVTNENDIRLVVNNVVQEPGSGKAYTATGTALTLSAALTNGTDEMYCVFLGRATATSAPGAGSIGTAQLAADSVTLAKMASGTDGNIISYDASGNPVAVATGNDGQVLTSTGAGSPPAFETPASAANTPAFQVLLSSAQTIPNTTNTKVTVSHELFDTDNAFASNRFTVPSGKGGSYLFNFGVQPDAWSFGRFIMWLYKNNSAYAYTEMADDDNSPSNNRSINSSTYMQLSAGDYIEMYVYQNNGSAQTIRGATNEILTYFGGHRLIT